jgi:protein SCO1/2
MRARCVALAFVLLVGDPAAADQTSQAAQAATRRYPVTGMVLTVDGARRTFVASIETIPGFMDAMTMPFEVKDARELGDLVPGAIVEFTLVVGAGASHAEAVRIRRYESVEQDPLNARRLSLLKQIAGRGTKALPIGADVPDFRLTDHEHRPVSLSRHRGKIVAINFMYTTCQLPDFCLRVVNHFVVLQKRFKARLGRDLILLTITFDPLRDTPDVLERYSRQWNPDPSWRFLTGSVGDIQRVLDLFGVAAFPNEGLMDHALHTVLIDRTGTLVANIEGNQYSSDQLGELTQAVLDGRAAAAPPR